METRQINITLGTAGHIDHGKTALVKLLTGCETARLKEEKKRGMSIELGFAPCTVDDLEVGIVDVPGHEHFIKTMVAGATGIDGVILVVAADDGVMPQTREHLDIMTILGVAHGIVALTKVDRAAPDRIAQVTADIRALTQGTFLEAAPILPISNVTGDGFWPFHEALTALVGSIKPKSIDGVFRLPVERGFSVKGSGTVLSGIPVSGSVKVGDQVVLLPEGLEGRVNAVQVYGRESDTARSGQCAALNVRHWEHGTIRRGDTLTVPGYFSPEEWYVCEMHVLAREGIFLKTGTRVKFHTGSSEAEASLYLMEGDLARAGDTCLVQLRLEVPTVAGPGDRFIVRLASPPLTVGGGHIIEASKTRLKRTRPEVIDDLKVRARAVTTDAAFAEYCLRASESSALSESDLSIRTKTRPARLKEILRDLAAAGKVFQVGKTLYLHRDAAALFRERILKTLADFHRAEPVSPGMTAPQLIESLKTDKTVLAHAVNSLKEAGKLVERNQRLALAEHREEFSDQERKNLDAVETLFRGRLFQPPDSAEVAAALRLDAAAVERVLRILVEHERLAPVADGLLFHKDAIDLARQKLTEFIQKEGELESVKFKYLLDTTRKFAIPLLDYFDRIGVTLRRGNTRYLKSSSREKHSP